jgi:hypothetical protein
MTDGAGHGSKGRCVILIWVETFGGLYGAGLCPMTGCHMLYRSIRVDLQPVVKGTVVCRQCSQSLSVESGLLAQSMVRMST